MKRHGRKSSKRAKTGKLAAKAMKAKSLEEKKEIARRKKTEQIRKSMEGKALSGYANR